MEATAHLRQLIAYNEWADARVLDTAAGVAEADLARSLAPNTRSILEIMGHSLGTQVFWMALWRGRFDEFVEPMPQTFAALRAGHEASHAALREYAASLTLPEVDREERWWKPWGYEQRAPVGQMIVQVINHGTQHRSEAALLLAMLGHSTGDLDYLVWLAGPALA